jgi:hypothetical protein
MKYFFYEGQAYLIGADWPEAVSDWMFTISGAEPPSVCAHCKKQKMHVSGNGWHCRDCRASAVRQLGNPSFTGRWPVGHFEPGTVAARDAWLARFEAMVDRSGGPGACHLWGGQRTRQGYGIFYVARHNHLAHRLAYLLAGGGFGHPVIMHSCDNPRCVNPAHLSAGTPKANVADMDAKGRRVVGDSAHLRDRPNHPKARAVSTPRGEFPSAALAGEAFGVSRVRAAWLAKNERQGWRYVENFPNPAHNTKCT